jgi:hypothetical protein
MANIVETDITRLIREAGGYMEAFAALVDQKIDTEVARTSRMTVADRKAGHLDTIRTRDAEKVKEMKVVMRKFADSVIKSEALHLEDGEQLSEKDQLQLMEAYIAFQKVKEFAEAWNEECRGTVFDHITAVNEELGVEYPEFQNGSIEVPKLGKRFCKEGNGRKAPTIDEEKLKEALGEDLWNKVQDEELVPAKVVKALSIEKLMKAVEDDPALLELVRESLIVGEFKNPRFQVRDLGKQAVKK